MSEIKVNSIKGVGASAAAITVNNSDGTCTANITNNLSNRRLTINGDMRIAQRGTSSTSSNMQTVDRFEYRFGGTDENPVQTQADVASGTTPYSLGFRKSYKIQNGNQTSGAGSSDNIYLRQRIEAQNIANSGWNYTSSSSFITLSFWVKSSVAQNFYGYLRSVDGTAQNYPFETGSLSADTWTKVTKTIPGNSNLQFDNDVNNGLNLVVVAPFWGTDYTDSSVTLNQWAAYASGTRTPDNTSTWYTTNDATLEITGVQLEVGSVATDFEHRSFGQELALCQRYFYQINGNNGDISISGGFLNASEFFVSVDFPVTMRATPSYTGSATAFRMVGGADSGSKNLNNLVLWGSGLPTNIALIVSSTSGGTTGYSGAIQFQADNGFLQFSAEL